MSTSPTKSYGCSRRFAATIPVKSSRALNLKSRANFEAYLKPAVDAGYIEMLIPDKPRSRLQKYRLTERNNATRPNPGRAWYRAADKGAMSGCGTPSL